MFTGPSSNPAASGEELRLLAVDDNLDDLDLCLHQLKKSGENYRVETASTREEFVKKLQSSSFDVVISDFRMKDWTGLDALEEVRRYSPQTPVILLTGTLGDERAVDCIKQGITDYVLKEQITRLPLAIRRAEEELRLRQAEARAIEALRASEARYRGLVDNAAYGMYGIVPGGHIIYANPALATMLGYDSPAELLRLENIQPIFRDPSVGSRLEEECFLKPSVEATTEWNRKDGKTIVVRLIGRRTQTADDPVAWLEMIAEDITDRSVLEKQLLQAQKFEAIGQLAGGIAHDFNNMIGAILGWADIGLDETEPDSRLHRHFEKMRHQAERAAALTRQLLAFARRQILEPRNIDLNQSVTETLSLLEKVIGGNIEMKTHLAPDLAVVRADPTQVEQVLMNLCINARDAMPGGGAILIETSNAHFDDEYCASQPFARPGSYSLLAVSDTGTGMDAATLDRIFEPFFTTKELGKGTGLGLATVYGIVRQHGGFVHVYSEPGHGTTFRIYLPSSSQPCDSPETVEDAAEIRGGSEVILVAEDHDGLRELARETLTNLGYRVLLACEGEQAVREFHEHSLEIDILLLDVVLPKLSGSEVYSHISQSAPRIPVIFATGYSADLALPDQLRRAGITVLQKPYSPRTLARKVRDVLDQHVRLLSRD
ncbi:MAG TPA: response regulator [Verrucomicrobiae bacterium]|nr:response regulator [Verrucomicrobiae bacterium]